MITLLQARILDRVADARESIDTIFLGVNYSERSTGILAAHNRSYSMRECVTAMSELVGSKYLMTVPELDMRDSVDCWLSAFFAITPEGKAALARFIKKHQRLYEVL